MKRRRIYHCAAPRIDDASDDVGAIRAWVDDDDVCHAPRARDVMRYLLDTVEGLRATASDQAPSCPRARPARAPLFELHAGADVPPPAMPPHPPDDGAARPKWNSKWDFDRAGERVRIVVLAYGPGGREETIDAREFIERLGETPEGTTFAIHVETEQIGTSNPSSPER